MRELLLVRHGESLGNVAAAEAELAGAEVVEVPARDADVALSPAGVEQSQAFGRALAALGPDRLPTAAACSPYVRAQQSLQVALETAQLSLPARLDERLRDRELGILDRLTQRGIAARYPDELQRRHWLGKFYHRPPGGESWADVALRVRFFLADIDRPGIVPAGPAFGAAPDGAAPDVAAPGTAQDGAAPGTAQDGAAPGTAQDGARAGTASWRLLVMCHDAVIMLFRYVCESLTEAEVLRIARENPVRNLSVTHLVRESDAAPWRTLVYNDVSHLEHAGAPVTHHPGEPDERPR
jgi:broad specificity phosphatase PhoE